MYALKLSIFPYQRSLALSTIEGYSGYGAEQGEKVCWTNNFMSYYYFIIIFINLYIFSSCFA